MTAILGSVRAMSVEVAVVTSSTRRVPHREGFVPCSARTQCASSRPIPGRSMPISLSWCDGLAGAAAHVASLMTSLGARNASRSGGGHTSD